MVVLNDKELDDLLDKKDSKSTVVKVKDKTYLALQSHFSVIETAWVQAEKTSVLWNAELASKGLKKRSEVYVIAQVKFGDGDWNEAIVQIPFTVLIQILEQCRLTGDDKYQIQWIVGKKGEGIETEYTVVKGKANDVKSETLEAKTKELEKFMEGKTAWLQKKSRELFENTERVNPDDIPF